MTREDIIRMAREVGGADISTNGWTSWVGTQSTEYLEHFAKLVAEKEREVVANWIMDIGFATGHGDSIVDLLDQLEWQIAEHEREACAKLCDVLAVHPEYASEVTKLAALAIRARGQA